MQTMGVRLAARARFDALIHGLVSFAEILAAFGVANDDMRGAASTIMGMEISPV